MSQKHILHSLKKYMFTEIKDNINNDKKFNLDVYNRKEKQKGPEIKIKPDTFFSPEYKDKFFWCFYIIKFGLEKFNDVNNKHFKIETSFKMNIAEELKQNDDLLKKYKIKRCEVETELINDTKISISTVFAMCLVYKINIIFNNKRTFIKLFGNPEDTHNIHVIKKDENDRLGVINNVNKSYIENIIENFYEQINYKKPILSISSYKLKEIIDISEKLKISLVSDLGKKKTKSVLYKEILSKV